MPNLLPEDCNAIAYLLFEVYMALLPAVALLFQDRVPIP